MSNRVLIVVHPDAACGAADRLLGDGAATARDAMALEIMQWQDDMVVLIGPHERELDHYAMLGIAVDAASTIPGRRFVRSRSTDIDHPDWAARTHDGLRGAWTADPSTVVLTGAWCSRDGTGHVDELGRRVGADACTISATALVTP
jgi:hypothetical protein